VVERRGGLRARADERAERGDVAAAEPSAGETPIGWKVIGVVDHDSVAHDVTAFAVCASP